MAKKPLPTPEQLRQLLRYDPETGRFFWKPRSASMFSGTPARSSKTMETWWNTLFAGKEAFVTRNSNGYKTGAVFCKVLLAHRVAWAMFYGEWPCVIDHINGITDDNRILNLRSVSHSANSRNQTIQKRSRTGVIGVRAVGNRWRATIRGDGRYIDLGYFSSLEEAQTARRAAERELGYHPNHGRCPAREG